MVTTSGLDLSFLSIVELFRYALFTAPILTDGIISAQYYINPIPAGLVLTGIVVSVSVTALMLSLTVRLYRRYHTLDIDRITLMMKGEDD